MKRKKISLKDLEASVIVNLINGRCIPGRELFEGSVTVDEKGFLRPNKSDRLVSVSVDMDPKTSTITIENARFKDKKITGKMILKPTKVVFEDGNK